MPDLPYLLNRTILIKAVPGMVYRFFTDSARWASWWGPGSTIDARPGGKVYIRHPNGVETVGEVLEVSPPERIAFTYGYASGQPIPPGGSRVTVELEAEEAGTRLSVRHEFADSAARDQHVQGWRFQLSVCANVVANEIYAGAAQAVDAWFHAWTIADERARVDALAGIVTPGVQFHDRFSALDGADDLSAHIGAALRFMPGITLQRRGDVRHCQGWVLADWTAAGSDGKERMSGTSLFVFCPDGRIDSVTGFTNPPASA